MMASTINPAPAKNMMFLFDMRKSLPELDESNLMDGSIIRCDAAEQEVPYFCTVPTYAYTSSC